MNREKREKATAEVQTALENFNGNPDTEKALRAIAEYLNIDIEV
jgi:hypothetical protein